MQIFNFETCASCLDNWDLKNAFGVAIIFSESRGLKRKSISNAMAIRRKSTKFARCAPLF